jgi:selenocysteine-specific elongation factor
MLQRGALEAPSSDAVALPGHEPQPTAAQARAIAAVLARLGAADSPPAPAELQTAGLNDDLRAHLEEQGRVVAISADVLMLPEAVTAARARLVAHLETNGSITVAAARDLLGWSRRTVVPFLEYLDGTRVTRREGDLRWLRRAGEPTDTLG